MKAQLIAALETICPGNVFLQDTLAPDMTYPESFITFFTTDTPDNSHFDNDTVAIDWSFSVIYYSSNPANISTVPGQIRSKLKQAGFIPQGRGYDIPSDVATHTGWAMEFVKIEYL